MVKNVFFIFLILSFTWVSSINATVETELEKADAQYAALNMDAALESYQKLYEKYPDNFEVLWKLIRSYGDTGEEKENHDTKETYFKKAKELAEVLSEMYPNTYEADLFMAATYGNLAKYAKGKQKVRYAVNIEKYAKKAQEKAPEEAFPYLILGIYYKEVAELSGVLKFFAKTLLGGELNGTYKLAFENLDLATKYNPDLILPYFQRALIYKEEGNTEKELNEVSILVQLPIIDNLDGQRLEISKDRLVALKK